MRSVRYGITNRVFSILSKMLAMILLVSVFSCSNHIPNNREIVVELEQTVVESPKNLSAEWYVQHNVIRLSWEHSSDKAVFKVYKESLIDGKPYYILLAETNNKNLSVEVSLKELQTLSGFGVSAKLNNKESPITVLKTKEMKVRASESCVIWSKEIQQGFTFLAFHDGVLYATAARDPTFLLRNSSSFLYAIDGITGRTLWIREIFGNILVPVVDNDGTIYVKTTEGVIYAFARSGELLWKVDLRKEHQSEVDDIQTGSMLAYHDRLYTVEGGILYQIDKEGNITKKLLLDDSKVSGIVLDSRGMIYTCNGYVGNKVTSIDLENGKRWEIEVDGPTSFTLSIGLDGTLFVGCKKLVAVDPDTGKIKWKYERDGIFDYYEQQVPPSIGPDGTVYMTLLDGTIRAIDPETGAEKWRRKLSDTWITAMPVIGEDGKIYVATCDGKIFCLNSDGEIHWELKTATYVLWTPVLSEAGILYVCTINNVGTIFPPNRGVLYAIKVSSNGLATLGWPRFQCNNKNSGVQR